MRLQNINLHSIAYDMVLMFGTLFITWLLPFDGASKIQIGALVLAANLLTIYFFHKDGFPVEYYLAWGISFATGLVIVVISLRIEPIWWRFFLLYARGHYGDAETVLHSQPHSNPFLFIGMGVMYASIAGIIRLLFVTAVEQLAKNRAHQ